MKLWERGESLAAICQRHLDGARATIERAKAERASVAQAPAPAPVPTYNTPVGQPR